MRIGHGLGHARTELVHASGVAGNAALTRIPVASRQVVQHDLQAGGVEPLLDFFDRVGIGEQKFNGFKTCIGGALETFEERYLGKQHAEVGSKTGHEKSPVARNQNKGQGRPAPSAHVPIHRSG